MANHWGNIDFANRLWLLVSLNHDRGYFSKKIENRSFDYDSFKFKLFTDDYLDELVFLRSFPTKYPDAFAYTYKEILAYDQYARSYHEEKSKMRSEKDGEHIDHGILGGAITFNEMIKQLKESELKLDEVKVCICKYCSLTIAQHNIFKSSNKQQDKKYPKLLRQKLGSDSPHRISKETPLLLFLCLVDTVEAVKKFSKGENSDKFLATLTTLKSIKVEIKENELILDLTELQKRTNKNNKSMKGTFVNYLEALKGMETWTNFHTQQTNDSFIFRITYQEATNANIPIAAMAKKEESYV